MSYYFLTWKNTITVLEQPNINLIFQFKITIKSICWYDNFKSTL